MKMRKIYPENPGSNTFAQPWKRNINQPEVDPKNWTGILGVFSGLI